STSATMVDNPSLAPKSSPLPPPPAAAVEAAMRHLQGAEDGVLAGVPARVILHGDEKVRLLNAQRLFGTRNIRHFVQATLPEKQDDLMSSIKYEAQVWARNPQSCATGVMWHLERKVERELAKLSKLRQKLEMCKNLAAKKSIPETKDVGVRQVTSKEQEQERQYQACPARISAWTPRLFVHRSACEIPISQTESRIACMQFFGRAFMAFAGQIQEEAINHEAEDAHYDFFPLQAHLVLDSPRNPHPLGRPPLTRSHNVHG
uniref:LOB domain-containing protein n=1 Tax=Oryza glaberrima TaxID=4538 RepID=I1NP83_ORYGL